MDNTSNIALSRLMVQSRAVEITANNLANVSTTGYRAERVVFTDWLSRQQNTDTPKNGQDLIFTQDRATYRDQTQGSFTKTANPLDMALGSDGYFQVQTANGTRLTRAGNFTLDASGTITDTSGNPLLSTAGQPITISANDSEVTVSSDGVVSTRGPNGQNNQVAQIGIVTPANPYALTAEGSKLFAANGPTSQTANPNVMQGMVEQSNVQPIIELTNLIAEQRDFQFETNFIESEGQRRQNAINKITDVTSAAA